MDYKEFRKWCAKKGVKDLTKEEYDQFFVPFPNLSLSGKLRFVKNGRSGKISKGDIKSITGYALGGRDFVYPGITIKGARGQFISVLTDEGEFEEVNNRGRFGGLHGRAIEMEVEYGTRTSKAGNEYNFQDLKVMRQLEKKFRLKQLKFRGIDDIDDDDVKTCVAIRGEVVGIYPLGILEETSPGTWETVDEYAFAGYKFPTCQMLIRVEGVACYVAWGPYKHSMPFVKVDGWDIDAINTIEDMHGMMIGMQVGVVGSIGKFTEDTDDDGNEMNYIRMSGTALFDLTPADDDDDGDDDDDDGADQEDDDDNDDDDDEPEPPKPKVDGPPPTSDANVLITQVQKGMKVLGDTTTVKNLKSGGYVNDGTADALVDMAIQMTKAGYASPEAEEEEEPETATTDPDPDDELETAILAHIRQVQVLPDADLKGKFRQNEYGGRETLVKHISAALKSLKKKGLIKKESTGWEPIDVSSSEEE